MKYPMYNLVNSNQIYKLMYCIIYDNMYSIIILCFILTVPMRLVGGGSPGEGRVEVYYNDQWGTVCDDYWHNIDAGVVCRGLGFGSSGRATYSATFGQGTGPIWLDRIACRGNEHNLANCTHPGYGVIYSCSHSEDAGVVCDSGVRRKLLVKKLSSCIYVSG